MVIEELKVRVPKYTYNDEEGRLEVSGPPFETGVRVRFGDPKMVMHRKRLIRVIPIVKQSGEETGLLVREDEKDESLYDQRPRRTKRNGRHFVPANF